MILYENSSVETGTQQGGIFHDDDFFGLSLFEEPALPLEPLEYQEPLHVFFRAINESSVKDESTETNKPYIPSCLGSSGETSSLSSLPTHFDVFAPLPPSQEQVYVQQRKLKRELVKRRRSLDDESRLKEMKRERAEKAQLTTRRKSLDSSICVPAVHSSMVPKLRVVKRSNLWTFEEEVFLVAAVMECFLRRGSLTSNKGRDGCWKDIKLYFDMFLGNYNRMNNKKKAANRLSSALYRHFKTLKERIAKDPTKDLREYYAAFLTKYNINGCLFDANKH